MAVRNYSNTAGATNLTAGIGASDSTLTVDAASGFPAAPFTARIDKDLPTEEIVLVTAVSGTTFAVTRGFDSTANQAHALGAPFDHVAIALDYREANAHVNATDDVHGITGSAVGTEGAQTIQSKTFTGSGGLATATDPAWTVTSSDTDSNLLVGKNDTTTIVVLDNQGLLSLPNLGVGTGTSIAAATKVEIQSADADTGLQVTVPDTSTGILVTDSGGTNQVELSPGDITASGSATVTGVLAADSTGLDVDVDTTIAGTVAVSTPTNTAVDGFTVRNSDARDLLVVNQFGDTKLGGTLTVVPHTGDPILQADTPRFYVAADGGMWPANGGGLIGEWNQIGDGLALTNTAPSNLLPGLSDIDLSALIPTVFTNRKIEFRLSPLVRVRGNATDVYVELQLLQGATFVGVLGKVDMAHVGAQSQQLLGRSLTLARASADNFAIRAVLSTLPAPGANDLVVQSTQLMVFDRGFAD